MSDVRNKPCMSHYPDFDHYCASKGQGCEYYEGQDKKLIDAIETHVDNMNTQTLRENVFEELTSFYFGNTVDQEIIDDFIEENTK